MNWSSYPRRCRGHPIRQRLLGPPRSWTDTEAVTRMVARRDALTTPKGSTSFGNLTLDGRRAAPAVLCGRSSLRVAPSSRSSGNPHSRVPDTGAFFVTPSKLEVDDGCRLSDLSCVWGRWAARCAFVVATYTFEEPRHVASDGRGRQCGLPLG